MSVTCTIAAWEEGVGSSFSTMLLIAAPPTAREAALPGFVPSSRASSSQRSVAMRSVCQRLCPSSVPASSCRSHRKAHYGCERASTAPTNKHNPNTKIDLQSTSSPSLPLQGISIYTA